jgi:hypothetical protein
VKAWQAIQNSLHRLRDRTLDSPGSCSAPEARIHCRKHGLRYRAGDRRRRPPDRGGPHRRRQAAVQRRIISRLHRLRPVTLFLVTDPVLGLLLTGTVGMHSGDAQGSCGALCCQHAALWGLAAA